MNRDRNSDISLVMKDECTNPDELLFCAQIMVVVFCCTARLTEERRNLGLTDIGLPFGIA